MRKTNTIQNLALQRLCYNKSRTLLTGIAILLTTMLLMAIGTVGVASLDMSRQIYSLSDYHASFNELTPEQVEILSSHLRVEALDTAETFADISNGKMNGVLTYTDVLRDDRVETADHGTHGLALEEGHYPEAEDEICSSPIFFRRMGAEPVLGGKMTLSFRVNGKGEILTDEFTISGLLPDVEIDEGIDDSRLMWNAYVSKAVLQKYTDSGLYQSEPGATLRVYGEDELSFDEMEDRILSVAADIGLDEMYVNLNKPYLSTVTDPGTEVIAIIAVICLVVILFSSLVIYSIYYVGVITDVQEIGKLKALGASRRQIAGMLYLQGAIVSAVAIPVGLLIGFLLPYLCFPLVVWAYRNGSINSYSRDAAEAIIGQIHMFSLPVLLAAGAASLATVALSLQKPIRMAKKVSPVEAIRYQENTTAKKSRAGHHTVKVSTLTFANLTRNKKRTTVTILTMGLSCVLFICVSAVLSSVSAEDIARRNIPKGDFRISLKYAHYYDKEYPENNLENLVQQNYFSDAFLSQLLSIEGVEKVEREPGIILSATDVPSTMYEESDNRQPLSYFTREDVAELSTYLEQGSIDYDRMTANNEIICTHVYSFKQYGLSIGDSFSMKLLDGSREIPFTATLTALTQPDSNFSFLIMTEDSWNHLGLTCDPTTNIYLYADDKHYDSVKEALYKIVSENEHFTMNAIDVELMIGRSSIGLMRNPLYLLLTMITVISFINLINTMITSIVTRKKEIGILQALGLSDRQLVKMLSGDGLFFTAGTLLISLTLGNFFGYLFYKWAKQEHLMSISRYHYPLWESIGLALVLLLGQLLITLLISKKMKKESLIERIRNQE